jgi:hypothetical protein
MTVVLMLTTLIQVYGDAVRKVPFGEQPAVCLEPSSSCTNIIAENVDIFGAECRLPSWCGTETVKREFASTKFLKNFYLCTRRKRMAEFTAYRLVVDLEMKFVFPQARFGRAMPAEIRTLAVILEVNGHTYIRSPLYVDQCVQGLRVDDICGRKKGGPFSYSQVPAKEFNEVILPKIATLGEILEEVPMGFEILESPIPIYFLPCAPAYGIVRFQVSGNVTMGFGLFGQETHIMINCEHNCILSYHNFTKVFARPKNWVVTRRLRAIIFEGDDIVFWETHEQVEVIITTVPLAVSNGMKICGFADIPKIVPKRVRRVLNFTHYSDGLELKKFVDRYECSVPISVVDDALGLLNGFGQLVDLAIGFLQLVGTMAVEFIKSMSDDLELLVKSVLTIVLEIVKILLVMLLDLMINTPYALALVLTSVVYYLCYLIERDNWVVAPIIITTVALAYVVRVANHMDQ